MSSSTNSALAELFASKLPNPVRGALVTRFAPEPSGYLHVGHVKAALLNDFFARYYGGKMLLRFDDTNPSKEKMEFEEAISADLALLGIAFEGPSYTSDEIPRLAEALRDLIRRGGAYCDDTPVEEMRVNRMNGVASPARSAQSVEQNLAIFERMLLGEAEEFCVRAKIDMSSANKAMRDPVFWRVNTALPHHRHGTRFKSYPTYDFACPLVDSWSGVTHALRANEYADRIPMYKWVQEQFDVRRVEIYEFSRLNLTNTVLSKRKLNWLVETGVVEGWDDPRFPTVRGMLRRGLTTQALMTFLIEQGPSKNVNLMTWDKLWVINAKIHDQEATRAMAVAEEDVCALVFAEGDIDPEKVYKKPKHPRRPELGEVEIHLSHRLLVEKDDAADIAEGEEITLIRLGNVVVDKRLGPHEFSAHLHLDGDVKATKKKLHWIPERVDNIRIELREYDHVINKAAPEEGDEMADIVNRESVQKTRLIGEAYVGELKEGDVVQLERRGFARCDRLNAAGERIFNLIPTGKAKSMSTVSVKVDAEKLAKGSLGDPEVGTGGLSKKALKRLAWKAQQEAQGAAAVAKECDASP